MIPFTAHFCQYLYLFINESKAETGNETPSNCSPAASIFSRFMKPD